MLYTYIYTKTRIYIYMYVCMYAYGGYVYDTGESYTDYIKTSRVIRVIRVIIRMNINIHE